MKPLQLSVIEFVKRHGKDGLNDFFADEKWNDFAAVLEAHLEDARDGLEIDTDFSNIRYVQGQANALRTILDLRDITIDIAAQMKSGMPDNPTDEDEDNERGLDAPDVI